jgi:ornithine lipid ester-linked acyl 2-hydroxylase
MALFLRTLAAAARLNRWCAPLGDPCFYDTALFPWAAELEGDWQAVRRELDQLLARQSELPRIQEIIAGAAAITQDEGWKIFILVAHGVHSWRNIALCPQTWGLVRRIPGLRTAWFSIFEPGKRLPPHRGPYNGVLRAHLGVLVPAAEMKCAIRVGSETRSWREGEVVIFDDTHEHETWNLTEQVRVVLYVDFLRPLRFPANVLNRALLTIALLTPYLREGRENLSRWERRFFGKDREHEPPQSLRSRGL